MKKIIASLLIFAAFAILFVDSSFADVPPQVYGNVSLPFSGLCLSTGGAQQGAQVIQSACSNQSAGAWRFDPVKNGEQYRIVDAGSGLCLNVEGGSESPGAKVIFWSCQSDTQTNDQWKIVASGNYLHIVSANSGLCLNVSGGNKSTGAVMIIWGCETTGVGATNDYFLVPNTTLSIFQDIQVLYGHCLSAVGTSTVTLDQCSGSLQNYNAPNSSWAFVKKTSGYQIISMNSGLCLAPPTDNNNAGQTLTQITCQPTQSAKDKWSIQSQTWEGQPYSQLVSLNNYMCANVQGASWDVGTPIIQWPCQTTANTGLNDLFVLPFPSDQN